MTARFQSLAPAVRLADQVADALAAEVRSGRLSEGDRLPTESALAEQFGVSRTVVREAVSRLKSLGLVDSRQGSGVYVRAAGVEPLRFELPHVASREAVIQMVELRRALEAEVAALAASRLPVACAAEEFPSRPISMVVPFPPGGGFDTIA
ncbi:GntR family transcriptional regulator, partial [Variovorax sp. CT11-76]